MDVKSFPRILFCLFIQKFLQQIFMCWVFFCYSMGLTNTINFMVPAEPQNFINFYLFLGKNHYYYVQHLTQALAYKKVDMKKYLHLFEQ